MREVQAAMNIYLEETEVDWTHRSSRQGDEFVSNFHDKFNQYHGNIEEQMRYDKGSIDNLYEGLPADDVNS